MYKKEIDKRIQRKFLKNEREGAQYCHRKQKNLLNFGT